jgi:tetratricopeptide (TPR) repeat protein
LRFPEYGYRGDYIGARRARHAFRFAVAALVVFTAMLWFSENYLRHPHTERLYMSALTLEAPSARPMLRQAVKQDAEQREFPTPKYVFALAVREEPGNVLETFAHALELDAENADLRIRYGLALLKHGRTEEAAEQFRAAADLDPDNALPMYLEASAAVWLAEGDDALRRSIALVARTNSSGRAVIMPAPLWSAQLPRKGYWYSDLRRNLVEEALSPIMEFADHVYEQARLDIEAGDLQFWDSWLEKMQTMGARVWEGAGDSEAGGAGAAVRAFGGATLQANALALRQQLRIAERAQPDRAFEQRLERLRAAQNQLMQFEERRARRIKAVREIYRTPPKLMVQALLLLFVVYLISIALARAAGGRKPAWTVPHARTVRFVLCGLAALCLVVLSAMSLLEPAQQPDKGLWDLLAALWWIAIGVLLAYGIAYPLMSLPRPRQALEAHSVAAKDAAPPEEEAKRAAGRQWRKAAAVLWRRYNGIALGLLACAACLWILAYRLVAGLYPWQLKLMVDGMVREEAAMVWNLLSGPS